LKSLTSRQNINNIVQRFKGSKVQRFKGSKVQRFEEGQGIFKMTRGKHMNCNINIREKNFASLITFLCIFAAIIILPLSIFAEDEQDIKYETGFYYTVQRGDTLWDISQRFFDSPWQWPGLWNENSQIPNPHRIYPGERLRLFHKGWIKTAPETTEPENFSILKQQKETPYFFYPAIDGIGFIKKEAAASSGSILKSYDDKIIISYGDRVYLKQNNNESFVEGQKYTIYRTIPVRNKQTKDYIGMQHYLTGILEITEKMPDFAVGRVIKSFRSIANGDLIMPYKKQSKKIFITESAKNLKGIILGTEEKSTIIGDSTIAFIDKGSQDSVMPGQYYSIYYQEKARLNPEQKGYNPLSIVEFGTLFVLHTEQTTSTVLITRSDKSINAGAKICSPLPKKQ